MADWLSTLLPLHWLRPWALLLLPLAMLLAAAGRRAHGGQSLRGLIDPHLLPHLLVGGNKRQWITPADTLALALACFSVALAGPAWEREAPPLAREQAPLMMVLDLSAAMDAVDLTPSRLEHARLKLQQLLERRGDAPTGLIVYAGSAHLVLPPAQDRQLLVTYLDALSTALMPEAGSSRPANALKLAHSWLDRAAVPGTVLFLSADWPASELAASVRAQAESRHGLVVWAIGTVDGGLIRAPDAGTANDGQHPPGHSRLARLDVAGLSALRDGSAAELVAVSQDDSDVARVQALIAQHQAVASAQDPSLRWRDQGAGWVWPGLLALLLSFRRGWVLRWPTACAPLLMAGLVLAMLVGPAPALAQDSAPAPSPSLGQRFLAYWLTPDQQGRWWLERNAPERAATHFDDALWRGAAHARAQQWQAAADAFAQLDSAAGWFNQAQMLARLGRYADAVAAYEEALTRAPGWPAALDDQARVRSLIPAELEPTPGEPSTTPGERAGKPAPRQPRSLSEHEVAELWLQRLDTSPAGFLRRKFALEAQALPAPAPSAPNSPLPPAPASARTPAAQ